MSRRTDITGPALVRLLSRLTNVDALEPQQAFADRLSQWLGWADAISLSAALNGAPAPLHGTLACASAEEGECTRVRSALVKAIAQDNILAPGKERGRPHASAHAAAPAEAATDFAPYRLRYQARQQAMDAGIGPLRERLRTRLAAQSPAMARLAAVDAVMERVLGEQERRLLAGVPALLEKRFERLRQGTDQAAGWQDAFGRDMQGVLLAELDIRFQPVEGLLDALRKKS